MLGGWNKLEQETFLDQCGAYSLCAKCVRFLQSHWNKLLNLKNMLCPCNSVVFEEPTAYSPSVKLHTVVIRKKDMRNVKKKSRVEGREETVCSNACRRLMNFHWQHVWLHVSENVFRKTPVAQSCPTSALTGWNQPILGSLEIKLEKSKLVVIRHFCIFKRNSYKVFFYSEANNLCSKW